MTSSTAGYLLDDRADTDLILETPRFKEDFDLLSNPREVITAVWRNRVPADASRRIKKRGQIIPGYHAALTAPKAYSILELLGIEQGFTGSALHAARACLDLLCLLASPAGIIADGVTACGLLALGVLQRLTREPHRPHRHFHLDCLSAVWHEQKQCYTGANLTHILESKDVLEAFFQHSLARGAAWLGYGITREKDSFGVADFPQELVDRFLSRPRSTDLRRTHARSSEEFDLIRQGWLQEVTKAELSVFKGLRCYHPSRRESFVGFVRSAATDLCLRDYFTPVEAVLTEALRRSFGRCECAANDLARLWLSPPPADWNLRSFQQGSCPCWASVESLAAERAFLDRIRCAGHAERGWLEQAPSERWWASALRGDTHRVAALSGPMGPDDSAALVAALGPRLTTLNGGNLTPTSAAPLLSMGTVVVQDADRAGARHLGQCVIRFLDSGCRVLLAAGSGSLPEVDSLQTWHQDGALHLITPNSGKAAAAINIRGPRKALVRVEVGTAFEAAAEELKRNPDAVLLCAPEQLVEVTARLRSRILAAERGAKRKALEQIAVPPARGLYVQYRQGSDSKVRGLLLVQLANDRGLIVRCPNRRLARVEAAELRSLEVFKAVERDLRPGDRLRVLRNCQLRDRTRLRRGQRVRVRFIGKNGAVVLTNGKAMPPEFGHWTYDYCASVDGPAIPDRLVFCQRADLERAVHAGWAEPRRMLVVCGEDYAGTWSAARKALRSRRSVFTLNEELILRRALDLRPSLDRTVKGEPDALGSVGGQPGQEVSL